MKKGVLGTLLVCLILLAGAQGSYTPEYDNNGRLTLLTVDINRDGGNDITDLALMAAAWLDQGCGHLLRG